YGVNMPIVALAAETCRSVATRLAVHELERLPVVDDAKSRRLVGLVSRSDLIKASLTLHEEEHQRQAFRHIRLRSDRAGAQAAGSGKPPM
ncbi:MAG TPA: CBS domain-containing protein, partial [Telluria sp.]|nr:CBS domain-containing protein [Telluria sp.]